MTGNSTEMSLKTVHVVFILACIALGLFIGAWSFLSPAAQGNNGYMAMGVLFLATAGGLIVYLWMFLKKLRALSAMDR